MSAQSGCQTILGWLWCGPGTFFFLVAKLLRHMKTYCRRTSWLSEWPSLHQDCQDIGAEEGGLVAAVVAAAVAGRALTALPAMLPESVVQDGIFKRVRLREEAGSA